jgi:hypothetical protein
MAEVTAVAADMPAAPVGTQALVEATAAASAAPVRAVAAYMLSAVRDPGRAHLIQVHGRLQERSRGRFTHPSISAD